MVFLISGLGPGHIETDDLIGTVFFENDSTDYYINNNNFNPLNLYYRDNDTVFPIIRMNNDSVLRTDLTTATLSGILSDNNIFFSFIPISTIWNNLPYQINTEKNIVLLSTTFMWNMKLFDEAYKWIKKFFPNSIIVIGGQYATLKHQTLINKYQVDCIILGDGEIALPLVVNSFINNIKLNNDIPNVMFKSDGKIITSTIKQVSIENINTPPIPNGCSIAPIMTMRGCFHKCKFCSQPHLNSRCRLMSAKKICSMIDYYISQGITHFDFADSTIMEPISRFRELLNYMLNKSITWEGNCRADSKLDPELIRSMELSGCKSLAFGFESMSDDTLLKMSKGTIAAQNRRINQLFKDSSILTLMSFIVGFPGETINDFKKTAEYLINEHYGQYVLGVFSVDDENMPILKESEKYRLKLFDDLDGTNYSHSGINWSHIGMNSVVAKQLRKQTIQQVRKSNNIAFIRSWLRMVEWPLIPNYNKKINYEITKLLDQLIYVFQDYEFDAAHFKIKEIANSLKAYHIYTKNEISG